MNAEDYKELINNMFSELDDSDTRFLIQISTLVKLHIEKKGQRIMKKNNIAPELNQLWSKLPIFILDEIHQSLSFDIGKKSHITVSDKEILQDISNLRVEKEGRNKNE